MPSSDGITASASAISVGNTGSTQTISVTTLREWTAFADDACSAWAKVTTTGTNKKSGTITVQIDANTSYEARMGNIVIKSGTQRLYIPVKQAATIWCGMTSLTALRSRQIGLLRTGLQAV